MKSEKKVCVYIYVCMYIYIHTYIYVARIYCEVRAMKKNIDFSGGVIGKLLKGLCANK